MEERFEIRDKRRLDQTGEVRGTPPQADQKPEPSAAGQEHPEQPQKTHHQEEHAHQRHGTAEKKEAAEGQEHGASFIALVMNLAAMAYMAMGIGDVPSAPNLPEAMYIIDSIDMLKEKTKGNLTPEEQKAIVGILYELKMNFSKVAQ